MFDGIYFEYPYIFFLITLFIVCEYFCKMRLPSFYFPHAAQFMQKGVSSSSLPLILKYLAICMMLLALSSPVKDEPYELEPKKGHEIAIIIDASQSMQARGFDRSNSSINRFDVVKLIVGDFIKKRKSDNMGLVVFGAYSFIASPLTYDENILARIVSQLQIGMAGKYTALYESLAQGVNLLKMSESKSKIAILLTDGYSSPNVDKIPLDVAIDMAKKEGVKVYPIGIGNQNEYNAAVLLKIAKETGGVAFGASNGDELEAIYKKIDELEKVDIKNESYTYLNYYYIYPLSLGLLFSMLYVFVRNKNGRKN
ncbi:VWA domain-containing protein [Sulfurimonas sp. SAG-AH-194-C21]|nr:VWA domain-containing protein [Sulfurimonas sp. SAG-AH-194-C21]MDF1882925.1 VWA domain-containing protein [Sulfurimonas sp. SAG-AH-194-C21]